MKKILYTLLSASLLVASCTKEVLVTGDHDVSAEVTETVTVDYEMLYCNLNDAVNVDVDASLNYVETKLAEEVELALLVVPATSVAKLEAMCADKYTLLKSVTGNVAACAIAKGEGLTEVAKIQNAALNAGALFVEYQSTYYVVSSLVKGTTEAACTLRTEQLEYLIDETIDKPELASSAAWIWTLNMNALAQIDATKYGLPYMDPEYDAETGITTELFAWQFASHMPLLYNNLIDCLAAQYSNYPYADNEWRYDFIYASPKAWQMMQPMTIDFEASYLTARASIKQEDEGEGEGEGEGDDEGEDDDPVVITPIQPGTLAVYPIIITIKSEEK